MTSISALAISSFVATSTCFDIYNSHRVTNLGMPYLLLLFKEVGGRILVSSWKCECVMTYLFARTIMPTLSLHSEMGQWSVYRYSIKALKHSPVVSVISMSSCLPSEKYLQHKQLATKGKKKKTKYVIPAKHGTDDRATGTQESLVSIDSGILFALMKE